MEIAFTKSDKLFTKSLSVLKVYWGGVIAYSPLKNSMNKVDDGHSPVDNKLTSSPQSTSHLEGHCS